MIDIKRIYSLTFLFIVFGFFAQAQDTIEIQKLKAGQAKRLGNGAIKQGDYHAAEEYFTQYTKLKRNNATGAFKLAEAYRINRDYVNAQEWYD